MAKDFADTIGDALIARKLRQTIEEGNKLQKEQLAVLKEIRDLLKQK